MALTDIVDPTEITDPNEPLRKPKPIVSLVQMAQADTEPDPFVESDASKTQRAQASIVGNEDADKAKMEKALRLSREHNVDPALIAVDPDAWERDFNSRRDTQIVQTNPAIRDYVLSSPDAAAVSKDDLGALDKITKSIAQAWSWQREVNPLGVLYDTLIPPDRPGERVVNWSEAYNQGRIATRLGLLGADLMKADEASAALLRPEIQRLQMIQAARPEASGVANYLRNLVGGFLGGTAEGLPTVGLHTVAGTATGSAIGAIGGTAAIPGVGTAIGTAAGFTGGAAVGLVHGFATVAAVSSTGNIYLNIEKIEGLTPFEKQVIAVGGGLTVGVLEAQGGKMVISGVDKIIRNLLSTEAGRDSLKTFVKEVVKTQAEGGVINAGQKLAEALAENIAKTAGSKPLPTIFNSLEETAKLGVEVAQSFMDGVILATGIGVPANIKFRGTRTGDSLAAQHALGNQQKLDQLFADSAENRTREISPQHFALALSKQAPDPTLYVDPVVAVQFRDKLGFIPEFDKQLANAQEIGTEIRVKQSDFVANLDIEVYKQMRDGVRQGDSSLSPSEALKVHQAEVRRREREAAQIAAQQQAQQPGQPPLPPKENIPDVDLMQAIFGIDPNQVPEARIGDKVATPPVSIPGVGDIPAQNIPIPPEAVQGAQSLIDRFLGKKQEVPTTDQFEAWIQAENLRNLLKIKPLQRATTSPKPEAIQLDPAQVTTEMPPSGIEQVAEALPKPDEKGHIIFRNPANRGDILSARVEGDVLHVGIATVGEERRGQGVAVNLYEQALRVAAELGLKLRSDMAVSPDAMRVYDALQRRGYEVKTAEGSTIDKKGATNATAGFVYEVTPMPQRAPLRITVTKTPDLNAEIGKPETITLLDHLRTLMANTVPENVGEAILIRALVRGPRNKAQMRTFITEESKLTGITDEKIIKSINDHANAALAALGTQLLKEQTTAVVNGLGDKDAQLAARATAQAIDQSRYLMSMEPLFATGEGKTAAQQAYDNQHIQDVQAAISTSVLQAARQVTELKESTRWNENRERMRPEVEQEVSETPVIVADEYLRTGKSRALGENAPNVRLVRDEVDGVFTKAELEAMGIEGNLSDHVLMKGIRWAKDAEAANAISADMMASMFNYSTAADMLLQLLDYRNSLKETKEGRAKRFNKLVNQELDKRMMEQYGNLDKIIAENSEAAAFNHAQMIVLKDELDTLANLTGAELIGLPALLKVVKERMRDMTNEMASNSKMFQNLAGKHGREAKEFKDAGDLAGALQAKKHQLQQAMLAKAAMEVKKEVNRAKMDIGKLTRSRRVKNLSPEYNTRLLQLLVRSGLDPGARTPEVLQSDIAGLKGEQDLYKWLKAEAEANGFTTPYPAYLAEAAVPITDLMDMKNGRFDEFNQVLKSLLHLGKTEKLVGERDAQLHLDEVIKTGEEQLASLIDIRGFDKFGDTLQPKEGTWQFVKGVNANHLKVETMTRKMDRLSDKGIWHRTLITPMKNAQKFKQDFEKAVSRFLQKVDHGEWYGPNGHKMNGLDKLVKNDILYAPNGELRQIKVSEMLMIAMNWGNEMNRQLMADTLKTDPTIINDWLIRNMTKQRWDFVENIWRMYEQEINTRRNLAYQRTRGYGMEFPEAIEFHDIDNKRRTGGYFPIMRVREGFLDPKKSTDIMDTRIYDALPGNSHRMVAEAERQGQTFEISMNFDELTVRIKEDIHDISFREAVINAGKIINDPRFYKMVFNAFGKQQADLFKPWLKNIANDGGKTDGYMAKNVAWMLGKLAQNAVSVYIGFNPQTMLIHSPTAAVNTVGEAKWHTFKAIGDAYGESKLNDLITHMFKDPDNFNEMSETAIEKSVELQIRMRDRKRDIAYSLGQWTKWDSMQYNAEWLGQSMIAYTDYGSAVIAWHAGYNKAIAEGFDEMEARHLGDRMVRAAHSAGGIMDKSALANDKYLRWFTQFFGFWNHMYNQMHLAGFAAGEKWRDAQNAKNYGSAAASMGKGVMAGLIAAFFYVGAGAYFHWLVRGKESDEHWGKTAAKEIAGFFGGLVGGGVREASYAALHGEHAKASIPTTSMLDTPNRFIRDTKLWWKKVDINQPSTLVPPIRTPIELAGMLGVKISTRQIGKWLEETKKLSTGQVAPPSDFWEWKRLFMEGHVRPIGTKQSGARGNRNFQYKGF